MLSSLRQLKYLLIFQRGDMSAHCIVRAEDLEAGLELSPEEVEENDANCEVKESSKVDNPFSNMLSNLLSGGGRTRRQRVIGIYLNHLSQTLYISNLS